MSEWIELTERDGKTKVFVNMALAFQIAKRGTGSEIVFGGGKELDLGVTEAPAEVIAKLEELTRANRT